MTKIITPKTAPYEILAGTVRHLFWTNGTQNRPSKIELINTKKIANKKIDWVGEFDGVLGQVEGEYNYCIVTRGGETQGYFMTKLVTVDVEKKIFTYSLVCDFWYSIIYSKKLIVKGRLVKTTDEDLVKANIPFCSPAITAPNALEFINLTLEKDEDILELKDGFLSSYSIGLVDWNESEFKPESIANGEIRGIEIGVEEPQWTVELEKQLKEFLEGELEVFRVTYQRLGYEFLQQRVNDYETGILTFRKKGSPGIIGEGLLELGKDPNLDIFRGDETWKIKFVDRTGKLDLRFHKKINENNLIKNGRLTQIKIAVEADIDKSTFTVNAPNVPPFVGYLKPKDPSSFFSDTRFDNYLFCWGADNKIKIIATASTSDKRYRDYQEGARQLEQTIKRWGGGAHVMLDNKIPSTVVDSWLVTNYLDRNLKAGGSFWTMAPFQYISAWQGIKKVNGEYPEMKHPTYGRAPGGYNRYSNLLFTGFIFGDQTIYVKDDEDMPMYKVGLEVYKKQSITNIIGSGLTSEDIIRDKSYMYEGLKEFAKISTLGAEQLGDDGRIDYYTLKFDNIEFGQQFLIDVENRDFLILGRLHQNGKYVFEIICETKNCIKETSSHKIRISYLNDTVDRKESLKLSNLVNEKLYLSFYGNVIPLLSKSTTLFKDNYVENMKIMNVTVDKNSPIDKWLIRLQNEFEPVYADFDIIKKYGTSIGIESLYDYEKLELEVRQYNEKKIQAQLALQETERERNEALRIGRYDIEYRKTTGWWTNMVGGVLGTAIGVAAQATGIASGIGAMGAGLGIGAALRGGTRAIGGASSIGASTAGSISSILDYQHNLSVSEQSLDNALVSAHNQLAIQKNTLSIEHKIKDKATRMELDRYGSSFVSSPTGNVDFIEGIKKVTGVSEIHIIRRYADGYLAKYLSDYYKRFGYDIRLDGYSLDISKIKVGQIYEFSNIDQIIGATSPRLIEIYVDIFTNGIRILDPSNEGDLIQNDSPEQTVEITRYKKDKEQVMVVDKAAIPTFRRIGQKPKFDTSLIKKVGETDVVEPEGTEKYSPFVDEAILKAELEKFKNDQDGEEMGKKRQEMYTALNTQLQDIIRLKNSFTVDEYNEKLVGLFRVFKSLLNEKGLEIYEKDEVLNPHHEIQKKCTDNVQDLETKHAESTKKISELNTQIADLTNQIQTKERDLEACEVEKTQLKETKVSLETKLREQEKALEDLKVEKDKVETAWEQARQQSIKNQLETVRIQQSLTREKQRTKQLDAEKTQINNQCQAKILRLENEEINIRNLMNHAVEAETKLKEELEAVKKTLEDLNKAHEDYKTKAEEEIKTLKDRLLQIENEENVIRNKMNRLYSKMTVLLIGVAEKVGATDWKDNIDPSKMRDTDTALNFIDNNEQQLLDLIKEPSDKFLKPLAIIFNVWYELFFTINWGNIFIGWGRSSDDYWLLSNKEWAQDEHHTLSYGVNKTNIAQTPILGTKIQLEYLNATKDVYVGHASTCSWPGNSHSSTTVRRYWSSIKVYVDKTSNSDWYIITTVSNSPASTTFDRVTELCNKLTAAYVQLRK